MTTLTMDALDIIRKHVGEADVDFLRETLQVVLHAVMDADVSQRIGADLHERTPDRADYRNGYRPRGLSRLAERNAPHAHRHRNQYLDARPSR